jgi:hypothetical protein
VQRAFGTTEAHRVRDVLARVEDAIPGRRLGTVCGRRLTLVMHRQVSDQISDVGHDPIVSGLDEPIFVQAGDVLFRDDHLLRYDTQQRLERVVLVGVAQAVNYGNQLVQAVRISTVCFHVASSPAIWARLLYLYLREDEDLREICRKKDQFSCLDLRAVVSSSRGRRVEVRPPGGDEEVRRGAKKEARRGRALQAFGCPPGNHMTTKQRR